MISRTLQKVRKGVVKRQRLVADPTSLANHLATFSTILLSQNPFQLHDAMIIPQCDIPYHILRTNRNATFFNIPMSLLGHGVACGVYKQKKLELRMYQTSKTLSNKSARVQLVSLFLSPLPLFSFLPILHHHAPFTAGPRLSNPSCTID